MTKYKDKIQHGIVAAAIVFVCYWLLKNIYLSCLISLSFSLVKEGYDKISKKGVADIWDICADIFGIFFAWFVVVKL